MKNSYSRMVSVLANYLRRIKAAKTRHRVKRLYGLLKRLYSVTLMGIENPAVAERLSMQYLLARNATIVQLNMFDELKELHKA